MPVQVAKKTNQVLGDLVDATMSSFTGLERARMRALFAAAQHIDVNAKITVTVEHLPIFSYLLGRKVEHLDVQRRVVSYWYSIASIPFPSEKASEIFTREFSVEQYFHNYEYRIGAQQRKLAESSRFCGSAVVALHLLIILAVLWTRPKGTFNSYSRVDDLVRKYKASPIFKELEKEVRDGYGTTSVEALANDKPGIVEHFIQLVLGKYGAFLDSVEL
ncbi:hypothetical protein SISSUDRAFT_247564 [Sistotremastrum suecicum HHB10207 ss-3]|uniref:Uncharacterized protein n=1 Tax=Sistotremastrum suecicum HHB10207 ss-3 TaxID=1314776 RepID=A0A165ZZ01_9AGAM|nr:hypothetical protein SISSUDRAFT_247564 [Sistotremastrum suecicum HHB10207 ss-3]